MGMSLRIGPITFYSRGRRKYPTCKICGRRTTAGVCRDCKTRGINEANKRGPEIKSGLIKLESTKYSLEEKKEICNEIIKHTNFLIRKYGPLHLSLGDAKITVIRRTVRKERRKIKKQIKANKKSA